MLETLKKALKVKEIRKRLLYTFVMLIVVRLGCQIAIPFVNADMVAEVTSPFKEGGFSFLYVNLCIEHYSVHHSIHHYAVVNNCYSKVG